jgi:uncharacterized protein (TIGR02246 family)
LVAIDERRQLFIRPHNETLSRSRMARQNLAMQNKTLIAISFVVFAVAFPRIALSGSSEAETMAIREVERQQQDAWNRHDGHAYANLFSENADCVNVVGWWWKGRSEIEKKLTAAYAFVFRESALTITQTDVKFPAPEMAIAHVRWTMVGARTPQGFPKPEQGIQTQLLQKQKGKWLSVAFQNTDALPEMPFPQGPPTYAQGSGVLGVRHWGDRAKRCLSEYPCGLFSRAEHKVKRRMT